MPQSDDASPRARVCSGAFSATHWSVVLAARKRGGGCAFASLDEFAVEEHRVATEASSAERAFDRRWAMTVLERAQERLRTEYTTGGKVALYEALRPFLGGRDTTRSYAKVAARLGMGENSLKSVVHRLRRRHGQLIREEIAGTVETPAQIEEEFRCLLSVVDGWRFRTAGFHPVWAEAVIRFTASAFGNPVPKSSWTTDLGP